MTPEERLFTALGARLARVEGRLQSLEGGGRARQLVNSSIDFTSDEDDYGGPEVRVDDAPMSMWGKQPDGTVATVYLPGPPPPAPTAPTVQPLGAAVLARWDGLFTGGAPRPADFRYVEVHASTVDGFTPDGGTKRTTILDTEADGGDVAIDATGPVYVVLVAVSTSSVRSEPSGQVLATPGPVVADELLDAIVGPEHLTPDLSDTITVASTQAAQAILDAATAQATADGAITTYFQESAPTGLNDTTDLGDLWYKTSTQQAHRWGIDPPGTPPQWILIQDNAIAEALAAAQNAQDTADGKIRSFFQDTPPDPGSTTIDSGDLWYDSNQGNRVSRWDGAQWAPLPFGTQALVARSITTALLAVGAVKAESIDVGTITAAHLSAVIALASTFIAGTEGAARVQLNADGLVKYNDANEPVVSFGASSDGGDYLAITGHAPVVRRNLCANPKLSNNSTGWSVFQAAGSRVSGAALGSSWCWQAADTGATTTRADLAYTNVPIVNGEEITGSFTMSPTFTGQFRVGFNWRNGAGQIINATPDWGSAVTVNAGQVTRLSATGSSTVYAQSVDVLLSVAGDIPTGGNFKATKCLIETGNTAGEYFDGDTTVGGATNLLANPGFQVNTAGWSTNINATLSRSAAPSHSGGFSCLVAGDPNDASGKSHFVSDNTPRAVVGGQAITQSAWVFTPTPGSFAIQATWLDSNAQSLTPSSTTTAVLAGTWTQLTAAHTPPSDAATVRFTVVRNTPAPGATWYLDDCSLIIGQVGGWDGTAGSSTSTLNTETPAAVALASLDSTGGLTVQQLAVNDPDPSFGGRTLTERINTGPGRALAFSQILGSAQNTISAGNTQPDERGIHEMSFVAEEGQLYKICSTPVIADGTGSPTNQGLRVRYTTDGTTPSTSSPILSALAIQTGRTDALNTLSTFGSSQVRLLFTVVRFSGTTALLRAPTADVGFTVWVEDTGPNPGNLASGIASLTTTWTNTWTRSWYQLGGAATGVYRSDTDMVQGYSAQPGVGHNATQIGFNDANIRATLAGATITRVEVYVYAYYWLNNSGGTVIVGTHNNSTPPAGFSSIVAYNLKQQAMKKPQGLWVQLPVSVGESFRDNTIKGLTLDAIFAGTNPKYTGRLRGHGQDGQPILRVTYSR